MDDEEIIEELEDIEEQPEPFKRRVMGNPISGNVPNALRNRTLSKNNEGIKKNGGVNKKKPTKKPLTKGLPVKDDSVANKLKRKNKPLSLLNRRKQNNNEDENSKSNDQDNDDGNSLVEDVVAIKKKMLIIKIALIAGIVLIVLFIIIILIAAIASVLGVSNEFSSLGTGSNIASNETYSKEAQEYYKKLNETTEVYKDSCGIYLNRSYIHAVLTYIDILSQDVNREKRYKEMADNADDVAKLMVSNCLIDYEIGGTFYNNLKNSSFFKNYYRELLEYMDAETLVTEIFEYAESGIELASLTSGYITDNLKVNMGTCEQPYNKKLLNEGTRYSSTVGFRDYVMGTIYGEAEDHITENKKEFLKAFTIVATSYALNRSGYKSGDGEIWVHNGNCWQVSCDIKEGCHYTKNLPGGLGTAFTGPDNGGNYWKKSISSTQKAILDDVMNEVFGTVMLSNSGEIVRTSHYDKVSLCGEGTYGCMGQDDAAADASNGMGYKEILEKYYDNYVLSNMSEDSYAPDVSYDDGGYNGSIKFYAQTDYKNSFCGLKNASISGYGCGITSMAMVLSTFINETYDPLYVNEEAYAAKQGFCGSFGTRASFFKYSANKHGLGYQSVSKNGNLQTVLNSLKSGNSLVIANVGPGIFTSGGHYIVLSAVRDDGKVYVHDPYHYVNIKKRNSGNGWYDFNNVIAKQVKSGYYIITKR